jgi:aminoglycoside phosphotransferase (APT) family kinase protein
VADQFPDWAGLEVRPVAQSGWDNHTFQLGERLLIRCPSARRYEVQVARDHRWLPFLRQGLSIAVPCPVAMGRPGRGYPFAWSVLEWIEGETALASPDLDLDQLALDLGTTLAQLQSLDATDAPRPGPASFHRGASPRMYEAQALAAIDTLPPPFAGADLTAIWHRCTGSSWLGPPVWLHGDVAPDNVLVRNGRLAALIDFGQMAAGDPSCDFAIAWQLFAPPARAALRHASGVDHDTWRRGAAWALWKAAIRLAGHVSSTQSQLEMARATLRAILDDGSI